MTAFVPGRRWRILAHERTGPGIRAGYTGKQHAIGVGTTSVTTRPPGHWEFDELVIDHWLHVEQMDARVWWIGVGNHDDGSYHAIWVRIDPQGKTTVTVHPE